MISNKSLRAFQDLAPITAERERTRIRAEIDAEMDATLAEGAARREAEAGRAIALRDTRQAKARAHIAEQERLIAEDATAEHERRAAIRAEVERDVRAWERRVT
ncbi:hypothetical protein [Methylobacterium sp. J-090]|uniref:hypothetical protein n=1 Tax=Methylobacterium sp. J-090 TaxID=2836666 RepID=UPI001FB89139|nr:hypothetical protein [Methylobacterium sp. J-090]MCJ2082762.1 hypothetical protein [Methylobacterium sp. J-090]